MYSISIESFQKYTGVYQDDDSLQKEYLEAAINIVENYLGYNIQTQKYELQLNGNGTNQLQLKSKPIKEIISIKINGQDIDTKDISINEEFINYDIFPTGNKNIKIEYIAGYGDYNNLENKIVYLTILRIAALLQSESDNNIGVTSKSFGESGGRTFINTVNFDKYLVQISKYKLLVI